jgi:hypothetical protein
MEPKQGFGYLAARGVRAAEKEHYRLMLGRMYLQW